MILFISTNVKKDGAEKSLVALQAYLNNVEKIDTMVIIPSHGEIEELLIENGVKYKIFSFVGSVNFGRGTKLLRGFSKMLMFSIFGSFLCSLRETKSAFICLLPDRLCDNKETKAQAHPRYHSFSPFKDALLTPTRYNSITGVPVCHYLSSWQPLHGEFSKVFPMSFTNRQLSER